MRELDRLPVERRAAGGVCTGSNMVGPDGQWEHADRTECCHGMRGLCARRATLPVGGSWQGPRGATCADGTSYCHRMRFVCTESNMAGRGELASASGGKHARVGLNVATGCAVCVQGEQHGRSGVRASAAGGNMNGRAAW